MTGFDFPVIDLTATGANIRRLRISLKLTVRDLQEYFGFTEPRVIYKWQKGECLPTVDNLFALSKLFGVPMDQILVQRTAKPTAKEQQVVACCSSFFGLPVFCGNRFTNFSSEDSLFYRIGTPPEGRAAGAGKNNGSPAALRGGIRFFILPSAVLATASVDATSTLFVPVALLRAGRVPLSARRADT